MRRNLTALVLVTVLMGAATGQELPPPAPAAVILKSALIPGWGEHALRSESRGFLFNGIEAALWIFAGVAYSAAASHENDLFYFATEYGQIQDPQKKSDVFLDRVSKYDSMLEYNEQMLRNRQWDRIYSAENGQFWEWESTARRSEYFDIKTQRYLWRQRLTYSFGMIALNHVVSTMDALYLKRTQFSIGITPQFEQMGAGLQLQLKF